MKTIDLPVYGIEELDGAAKERARAWSRESRGFDNEGTLDEAREVAFALGVMGDGFKIHYSGFASQGDGACWAGEWRADCRQIQRVAEGWGESPQTVKIKRIAADFEKIAAAWPLARVTVTQAGRYYHEHSAEFDFSVWGELEDQSAEESDKPLDEAAFIAACNEFEGVARDFSRWIYRQLEEEYYAQTADDAIDDDAEERGDLFDADGRCVNRYACQTA